MFVGCVVSKEAVDQSSGDTKLMFTNPHPELLTTFHTSAVHERDVQFFEEELTKVNRISVVRRTSVDNTIVVTHQPGSESRRASVDRDTSRAADSERCRIGRVLVQRT
jgi:hypothetical protein